MFWARIFVVTLLSLSGLRCEGTNEELAAENYEKLKEYYLLCSELCKEKNRECSLSSLGSCGNCLSDHEEDISLGKCVLKKPVRGSPDAGRWDSLIDENIDKVAKQQEKQVQKETLNKETSNPDVAPLVEPVERTGPQQELNAAVNVSNKVPVVPPPPPYTQRQKQKVTTTEDSSHDFVFYTATGAASAVGIIGLIAAAVCYYRLQKNVKAASEAEYPAYGVTGPTTKDPVTSPGDRKLAQSAQMYHYQHQKQQMIALEKANSEMKHDASDEDSEEENEEGDYTVYECPGLAPTGEMEVKNPLFSDDTPATPPSGDRKDDK